ncbi:MAG: hypothetical protein WA970_20805, partial [Gammaproteobacteria bacterium]
FKTLFWKTAALITAALRTGLHGTKDHCGSLSLTVSQDATGTAVSAVVWEPRRTIKTASEDAR